MHPAVNMALGDRKTYFDGYLGDAFVSAKTKKKTREQKYRKRVRKRGETEVLTSACHQQNEGERL